MENLLGLELSLLFFVKIAILFFLLLYIVFAGVVIRQVRVMAETLQVGFEKPIKAIAFFHFLFSLLVFVIALFVL
jgi:hypothetical protein